jgi:hypothetical protein
MGSEIIERVLKKACLPELMDVLTRRLSQSELQSLLIEVYRQRAGAIDAGRLIGPYRTNRFVRPSMIPPERMLEFDRLAFSLLPDTYEAVELSPVSPLGSCSAVAPVSQNNILSTIRNTEVCSELRYNLFAENAAGEEYFLCDGGFTDWTARLLNRGNERYLISGFGTERLLTAFAPI